jgi:hypothetical protein
MLSQRAKTYLNGLRRADAWMAVSEKVAEYFANQKLLLTYELSKIQTLYSGYNLTIYRDPGHTFLLNFISKKEVSSNAEILFYIVDNKRLIEFGAHATAQFTFYITDLGEICTWGPEVGEKPNIICSTVEKYIEQYALKNELATQVEHPGYYQVTDAKQLDELLYREFIKTSECSDDYSYWGSNGFLTVVKGTWLHEPKFYLHVYGRSPEVCIEFIKRLKVAELIK